MDRVDMPENSREFDQQDRDEVKSVEIVTTAAAHITNAPYDYPATEEISSPSPDQVTGREERPSCTSSCRRTMKEGHRLVSSLDITFSKVSPSVDTSDHFCLSVRFLVSLSRLGPYIHRSVGAAKARFQNVPQGSFSPICLLVSARTIEWRKALTKCAST